MRRPGPLLLPVPGGHHHNHDKEPVMDIAQAHSGASRGGEGDNLPGTPWTPPQDPPSPDGGPPPGDGGHRK
ncbi:hypothetical protein GCM10010495_77300 [Kitasatospora herbaricolor]|nr:hypothetical protein GCM10010495_77300 [Kitasatospora herbaricolor]